jgi:hypothetical protein
MKTILLLHDETRQPTQLLRDALPAKIPVRETETIPSRSCDRWGHPCPGCVERIAQPAPGASDFNAHEEMR